MSDEPTSGSEDQTIVPRKEQTVNFYGDEIPVALTDDEQLFVPLRPLVGFLGLNRQGQQQRVMRDPVMSSRVRQVMMQSADGKRYANLCLPLDLLPGWLFGISTARVSPELQDKLNRYRAEAFRVLWNAFKNDIMPAVQQPTNLTPAELILAQAEAIARLARQQVDFERGLAEAQSKHQTMADYMRGFVKDTKQGLHDHDQRISALELRVASEPTAEPTISEQQAAEIALAVKNVGILLTGVKGSNSYGQVYGELYRRYGVGAYRELKLKDYEAARKWLKDWHEELIDKLGEEGTGQ